MRAFFGEMFDGIRIRIKLPKLELGLCIMRTYACHGIFVQTGCFGGIDSVYLQTYNCSLSLSLSLSSSLEKIESDTFFLFLMCDFTHFLPWSILVLGVCFYEFMNGGDTLSNMPKCRLSIDFRFVPFCAMCFI